MDRWTLAEQKFRPLKKAMQQTFKRLQQEAQTDVMPEKQVVLEFMDQARLMVSYPGFGDADYPQFLAVSDRLAASHAKADMTEFREALAAIVSLQARCHAALEQK